MATAVLVPWAPADAHREAAWSWVRSRYEDEHPDWEIIEGHAPDGSWCKALAVQDALERTDADTLVIADADVWSDGLGTAVEALAVHQWSRPHELVHRLTIEATQATLEGVDDLTSDPYPYRGVDGGGIACIRRATYEAIPLDPRFRGWGGEDASWGIALHVLVGAPYGVSAFLLHLWHPPQPDASKRRGPGGDRFMNDNNRSLYERYKHHRKDPAGMRTLVDEAREALHGERQDRRQPQGREGAPAF